MATDADQERLLADCLKVVKDTSFYMKRHIDGGNLKLALGTHAFTRETSRIIHLLFTI